MKPVTKMYGVTLIELMIAMTIVAILAGMTYPSYRNSVIKSNRTEGKAALMRTAENLEKCFTRFSTYNSEQCSINANTIAIVPVTSASGKYQLTGSISATTFKLTAMPLGSQNADTGCGNLTLDNVNNRGRSGTANLTECW